jgi:hypothetical protein
MSLIVLLFAASSIVACPSSIADAQTIVDVPGWQIDVNDARRNLDYMNVYAGHPSRHRSLQPSKQGRDFVWSTGTESVWVECHYRDSAAVLVRRLGMVRSCKLSKPPLLTGGPNTAVCQSR